MKRMALATWVAVAAGIGAALASEGGGGQAPTSEEVTLAVGTDTLYGTLEQPVRNVQVPLVILLSGSGPTDRDGNTIFLAGKNNSLKMLADSLARRGIATLRYDKRGVGRSMRTARSESDLRVTTYADDAAAWVKQYRGDPRFSKLVLLGHSEGALIGTLAAKQGNVDGLVLVSGAGRPARVILHEQLSRAAPPDLQKKSDEILDSLQAGHDVTAVPPQLLALYRPSVQGYVRSWLAIDPAGEVRRLTIPTLVVQGTTDIQVSVADAESLAAARKGIDKVIVKGMNHVLKSTSTDPQVQLASYSDSTLALAPGVVAPIARFVQSVKGR